MGWIYLGLASVFEVIFAVSMKQSEGFTRLFPSVLTGIAVICGIFFLTLAMKTLPVSVAYPVWTSVGTLGTVLLGFLMFGEALTPLKLLSATAIVIGVAGLKLSSG